MAKRIISELLTSSLFLLTLSASAAIPVRWTVDTFRVKPLVYECYHGETLDLAAAMTAYGDPLDLHGKTAKLYWQTNGMDDAYWSTNATIKAESSAVRLSPSPSPSTNVLSAIFSGAFDPGAPSVSGFIGVEGENYRAAFTLNFKPSPGFTPAHIAPPVKVLDFATTAVANPEASPFMVKGGSGGISAQQATNIASAVVAPATNAISSVLYPLILERATSNDVNAIIASSNLCTVAAAQAMTNDMEAVGTTSQIVRGENMGGNNWSIGVMWEAVYNTPNTLDGYGIYDAYTSNHIDANFRKAYDNVCHTNAGYGAWTEYPNIGSYLRWDADRSQWIYNNENQEWYDRETGNHDYYATRIEFLGSVFTRNVAATKDRLFVTVDNVPSTNGLVEAAVASATNSAKAYSDATFLKDVRTNGVSVVTNGVAYITIPQGGGSFPTNALVLTNNAVKTVGGTSALPKQIDAVSASEFARPWKKYYSYQALETVSYCGKLWVCKQTHGGRETFNENDWIDLVSTELADRSWLHWRNNWLANNYAALGGDVSFGRIQGSELYVGMQGTGNVYGNLIGGATIGSGKTLAVTNNATFTINGTNFNDVVGNTIDTKVASATNAVAGQIHRITATNGVSAIDGDLGIYDKSGCDYDSNIGIHFSINWDEGGNPYWTANYSGASWNYNYRIWNVRGTTWHVVCPELPADEDINDVGELWDNTLYFSPRYGGVLTKCPVRTQARHGSVVSSALKINGIPLTNDITIASSGITTNDVKEIAASSSITNLGAVAAATNSAKAYADATFAPKLTGRTYDFHNGTDFTKNLYIALTNVIQTLGGSVTNAPAFN